MVLAAMITCTLMTATWKIHHILPLYVELWSPARSNLPKTTCGLGKIKSNLSPMWLIWIFFHPIFRFRSDSSVNGHGFLIEYTTIAVSSTTPTNDNATTITPSTTTTSANYTTPDSKGATTITTNSSTTNFDAPAAATTSNTTTYPTFIASTSASTTSPPTTIPTNTTTN